LDDLQTKLTQGTPSVMEYTTLIHIIKSGILANIPDAGEQSETQAMAVESYFQLTGAKKSVDELLRLPLPSSVLAGASYRERQFHLAVFRSPDKIAAKVPSFEQTGSRFKATLGALVLLAIGLSAHETAGSHGELLSGAIMGYTISALAEWITHRYYLHASPTI